MTQISPACFPRQHRDKARCDGFFTSERMRTKQPSRVVQCPQNRKISPRWRGISDFYEPVCRFRTRGPRRLRQRCDGDKEADRLTSHCSGQNVLSDMGSRSVTGGNSPTTAGTTLIHTMTSTIEDLNTSIQALDMIIRDIKAAIGVAIMWMCFELENRNHMWSFEMFQPDLDDDVADASSSTCLRSSMRHGGKKRANSSIAKLRRAEFALDMVYLFRGQDL